MIEKKQEQCARCGSCTAVCPVYHVTGRESLTARGKLHLLGTDLADLLSGNYQDLFSQCLLCGACEDICPRQLQIRAQVVDARSRFFPLYVKHGLEKTVIRLSLARPGLIEGLARIGVSLKKLSVLPADSGLRFKLGLLEEPQQQHGVPPGADEKIPVTDPERVMYFTGCLARFVQPSIAHATSQLYNKTSGRNLDGPSAQACCGLAAWTGGKKEEARALARKNISAFQGSTGPIVTSCASCSSFLKSYPELFESDPDWLGKARGFSSRIREFASFFAEEEVGHYLLEPDHVLRLYYHEPCHLRFSKEKNDAPRTLIDSFEKMVRVEDEGKAACCGQGGLFQVGYPELSGKIFSKVYRMLDESGAGVVVTTCSGCLMQWQIGLAGRKSGVTAVHLAVLLNSCLDIDA